MDMLLATGEQISIALLAMAIQSLGEQAVSFTGAQVGIVTDSTHTKARIKSISTERMRAALRDGKIAIVAGFQGIDEQNNITTLGRGGSDTTAVALAAVMKLESGQWTVNSGQSASNQLPTVHSPLSTAQDVGCEIYTDVDGVFTTDPRIVSEARKLDAISYDEMLELASVGAGVMHSRSIEFAKKFDVPLQVRSSLSDAEGTWIVPEEPWMREPMICGAAMVKDEARVSIDGVPDKPGVSREIFNAIADRHIVVDMIVQNVGTAGKASIGFTVPSGELQGTLAVLNQLAGPWGAQVVFEKDVSKVSIVGVGMQDHTGVAQKMFAALAEARINLKMITTGDIKISVLVDKSDGVEALRAVHRAFDLGKARPGAGGGVSVTTPAPKRKARPDSSRDIVALAQKLDSMEDILVSDVQYHTDQGRITIFQLPDRPGICSRIFEAVADAGIIVDMIVQNLTGAGRAGLSFSVPKTSLDAALTVTRQAAQTIDLATDVGKEDDIARLEIGRAHV